jgi:hypothetical protein
MANQLTSQRLNSPSTNAEGVRNAVEIQKTLTLNLSSESHMNAPRPNMTALNSKPSELLLNSSTPVMPTMSPSDREMVGKKTVVPIRLSQPMGGFVKTLVENELNFGEDKEKYQNYIYHEEENEGLVE